MTRPGADQTATSPPPWQVWSALGAVYVIWGSTYLAIRVMVETVPPFLGAGVRFLLAGVLLLAWVALRGGAARPDRTTLAWAGLTGVLLPAGGNGLVTVAEQDVPSGLAALLVASVPLWVVLWRTAGRDRPSRGVLGGVALGFVGVAVLLLPGGRPDSVPLGMSLLVVLAACSWGLGSVLSQRMSQPRDMLSAVSWQMLAGGAVLTVAALPAGEFAEVDPSGFALDGMLAFAWLVLAGSIVAFSAYTFALKHAPVSKVATYAYVNPVIAVMLGAVILDEVVAAATVAGMALIVASVAVVVRLEGRRAAEARQEGCVEQPTPVQSVASCNQRARPAPLPSSSQASS